MLGCGMVKEHVELLNKQFLDIVGDKF